MSDEQIRIVQTYDDENEAREQAGRLFHRHRLTGVVRVMDWNDQHPDRIIRTTDRWAVIERRIRRGP